MADDYLLLAFAAGSIIAIVASLYAYIVVCDRSVPSDTDAGSHQPPARL